MEKKTLKQLFESQCDVLAQRLGGMKLPKDAERAQAVVSNYLNELFDGDGEFRQNLTQSEDYILQAAMSLLNAQQSMIAPLSKVEIRQEPYAAIKEDPFLDQPIDKANAKASPDRIAQHLKREQYPTVIGGSAIGGAAGALIMGTWGAVFGAIAGTALVLYVSSQNTSNKSSQPKLQAPPLARMNKIVETPIDINLFLSIVSNICDSLDSLIATFRAQINRVVNKYENQAKPTIEQEYRFMLESIQTLVGYERTHADDEKYLSKLQMRVEDLAETLENYNLTIENYTEDNRTWFEATESDKVTESKMVYPAIVRDGQVVLSGKVFVPKK